MNSCKATYKVFLWLGSLSAAYLTHLAEEFTGTNTPSLQASLPGWLKGWGLGEDIPTTLQITKFLLTTICGVAVTCPSLQTTEATATDSVLMKLRI